MPSPARSLVRRVLPCSWLALALLGACSPALNWRDVRPEGTGLVMQFPCRPDKQARTVALAGAPVRMALSVCDAGARTWALIQADVGDPARLGPALTALRTGAAANLGADGADVVAQAVAGATPHPQSGRSRLVGRLPDGRAMQMTMLVFARGTQVFQASVVGEAGADEAVDSFLASIRFPP